MTTNTLFKTLVHEWLKAKKPMVTPSTHANFTLIAVNHLLPHFGRMKIGAITEANVQSYVLHLHAHGRLVGHGGLSPKSIHDILLVFRLTMAYAYKLRLIPLLNWSLIEYPKSQTVRPVASLSQDQERLLIQTLYLGLNRRAMGILLTLFTGLRIGELCALQMKDVDLTAKTLSVNRTLQRIYDKRTGKSRIHIGPPKTATSLRTIPLPSLLVRPLEKFVSPNCDYYLLTGRASPTEPRTYRQFFVRYLKRHGLSRMRFHELRHTFAVRAMEINDFDIKSLSEILGHKNVSFTLNVYGRANLQQKTRCMNLLNDLL